MHSSSTGKDFGTLVIWRKIIHSCAEFRAFKVGIYLISKQKFYFSNNVTPHMYGNSKL